MADNYLENRMEAYRSGRLARQSRSTPAMRRPVAPASLSLSYPPMVVVVRSDTFSPLLEALVLAFRSVDARVAFSAGSAHDTLASRLAQLSGARFYPLSAATTPDALVADISSRWGGPDHLFILNGDGSLNWSRPAATLTRGEISTPMAIPGAEPEAVARLLLFLSHPSNVSLLK